MKMKKALEIIDGKKGFTVSFEHVRDGLLKGDHFPDVRSGEPPIPTEEEAWELAARFAHRTFGKCVNIYVCGSDHIPVANYKAKMIRNRY